MQSSTSVDPTATAVSAALEQFCAWLEQYGELSWDHQSYYSGPYGRAAKRLYYQNKLLGTAAVAPMVFSEAFFPAARRLFHQPIRLPIADAHYAMGFAFLHEATGGQKHLAKAVHFLEVLKAERCPDYANYCWGYPFSWVTRNRTLKTYTPIITTTPYVFEALLHVQRLQPRDEWRELLASTARYASDDIDDRPFPGGGRTCAYLPGAEYNVVNASAYRAGMLAQAATFFGRAELVQTVLPNIEFVLHAQNADGSWPYAKDGVRDFVDHFHTCFVMKGLAKVYFANGDKKILDALKRGADYYLKNLFGEDGMPRPFSKAPRLTVYKCELYDCAECINLCLLLRKEIPTLQKTLETVVSGILQNWIKPDGSFRSRKLILGWDNVPMHRWAQSQMFCALAFYLREEKSKAKNN
jgi:hypothetical protein